MHLVFLLEEPSAKAFLDIYLPRVLPEDVTFQTVPHQGKSDLQRSIPKKLAAWRTPDTCFVVMQDQDANECRDLKRELVRLCHEAGRPDTLVRIACRELEAWFLGDLEAVAQAYPRFAWGRYIDKAQYRDPDAIVRPSRELMKLIPDFQKVSGARALAPYIERHRNRSKSFHAFLGGVTRMLEYGCAWISYHQLALL
jgi:hypothetical protein